jgi:hypothetical protein
MDQHAQDRLIKWAQLEREAAQAESEVRLFITQAAEGTGDGPTISQLATAARSREAADDMLRMVLDIAEANDPTLRSLARSRSLSS